MKLGMIYLIGVFVLIVSNSYSTLCSASDIYKTVHTDGTVTYSDTPSAGAVKVNFSGIRHSEISALPNPRVNQSSQTSQLQPKKTHPILNIITPVDEATVRSNNGDVTITASITPSLSGSYVMMLDGVAHQNSSGSFKLSGLNRGTHIYTIQFLSKSGKVIASSPQKRFHLHQASVLNRAK